MKDVLESPEELCSRPNDPDVWRRVQRAAREAGKCGIQSIVGIQGEDVLARRGLDGRIPGARYPGVRQPQQPESGIVERVQHLQGRCIGGPIIGNDHFTILVVLLQCARDGLTQVGPVVVARDDNADARHRLPPNQGAKSGNGVVDAAVAVAEAVQGLELELHVVRDYVHVCGVEGRLVPHRLHHGSARCPLIHAADHLAVALSVEPDQLVKKMNVSSHRQDSQPVDPVLGERDVLRVSADRLPIRPSEDGAGVKPIVEQHSLDAVVRWTVEPRPKSEVCDRPSDDAYGRVVRRAPLLPVARSGG